VTAAALIKTLGKLFLKLELRSKDGSARKTILVSLSYLVAGFFVSFLVYRQSFDASGLEFAFLSYLLFSILMIFVAVSELDNLVISPVEAEVLAVLPIQDKIVARAKLYVLIRYVFVAALPLLLPGAAFFQLRVSLLVLTILYIAAGFLLFVFLLSLLVLLYAIALCNIQASRVSSLTLVFQALLIFILILGYQYISFSAGPGTNFTSIYRLLESTNSLQFFPQAWFAVIPARHNYPQYSGSVILRYILPLAVSYFSYLSLKLYLMDNYQSIYQKFTSRHSRTDIPVSRPPRLVYRPPHRAGMPGALGAVCRGASEAAAFSLMQSMFRRDKSVKLNMLLMFIVPSALTLFALMSGQLYSPFTQFFLIGKPVFHISILITSLIAVSAAAAGIKATNEPTAAWIYDAYPIQSRKSFTEGVRKFFLLYFILPLFIFFLLVFSLRMPFYDAFLHSLYIISSANLFNTIYHSFSRSLPFTRMNTVLNSVQRIAALSLPLAAGIIFVVIQYYVYQKKSYVVIAVAAIALLNFLLLKLRWAAKSAGTNNLAPRHE